MAGKGWQSLVVRTGCSEAEVAAVMSYQQEDLGPKRKKDEPVKGAAANFMSVGTLLLFQEKDALDKYFVAFLE